MVSFLLVAAAGTATVLTRRPRLQVVILGIYSLTQVLLFGLLQAPDVALAELGVGAVVVPIIIFSALRRIGRP